MPTPSPELFDDPRYLPYAPVLYVAWADGELTTDELTHVSEQLAGCDEIDPECRAAIGAWLDPGSPPSARQLRSLLTRIQSSAGELSLDERRSLADLGEAVAAVRGHVVSEIELGAIARLEEALGVAGAEAAQEIVRPRRPEGDDEEPEPGVDVAALRRLLDGSHHDLRAELRSLLAGSAFRLLVEPARSEYREQVLTWTHELADRGYGALAFPPAFGGRGDLGAMIAAFETIAYHDLSLLVKFGVQFGLFAGSVYQLGTEHHHQAYLGPAVRLELPGCFAMTETAHGSNVQDLETVATFDAAADEWVVETPHERAAKDYIGNAALHGRLATVFAQLVLDGESHGVHAFLVPIRDEEGAALPGIRFEDNGPKEGLNGVDNGRIWFDRVRVPRRNLLDRFARVDADGTYHSDIVSPGRRFFTMLGTLVGGRVSIAHAALSVAKTALTIAVRYGERRRQFGPAGEPEMRLLDYPTHQRRLLPRLAACYAYDFALEHLAERFVASEDDDRREVESLAAGLKALVTWHAIDAVQEAREACGGRGYLSSSRLGRLKADCDVFATFEGDNVVLLQLVAKGLLADFRKQFGRMSLVSTTRYIAKRAAEAIVELNPVVTRITDPEHLNGSDFQLGAMRWREKHLLGTLARRLRSRIQDGQDTFRAFLECQVHAVELARAHVESLVLEQFVGAIERVEDPTLVTHLDRLRSLFALSRIEADRGWFMEHGVLEPGKAKAIRHEVDRLCGAVRPEALGLVAAFAIPDPLLPAIGRTLSPASLDGLSTT